MNELEQLPLFQDLSDGAQALLQRGLVRRPVARRALVLQKGEPISGAYLVLAGRLRVYSLAANGTEATLYFIEPGEVCVLALNCLFGDVLYPAWVQAETSTSIALIPGPLYRRLFEQERAFQSLTIRALSGLVVRLMCEVELLHSTQHRQRLANFILLQARSDGTLRMTQQELAHHLGTTREVIARLMQTFVASGFVSTARGRIDVRDMTGLRTAALESRGSKHPRA